MQCDHSSMECVNPYELIRKYRCLICKQIMMCDCEKDFAERFIPHQLTRAVELTTQKRTPVTLGFQPAVCKTCRGLPEDSSPKAPSYGHTSKIYRYYWR